MNQPDRYERFVLPEGVRKLEYQRDTKLPNAGKFVMQREDHTMGNLIRMTLHERADIVFAGYRIPHPLEHRMEVRVQTTGRKAPDIALSECLEEIRSQFQDLRAQAVAELSRAGAELPRAGAELPPLM